MEPKLSSSSQLFTAAEMQEVEADYCSATGCSMLDLMEEAGGQVAAYINQNYDYLQDSGREVLILSGPGNNGGDGFVVARKLRESGFKVQLLLVTSGKYSSLLQTQIELIKEEPEQFKFIDHSSDDQNRISLKTLEALLIDCSIVVDCLLGTGQQGSPKDLIGLCVQKIMEAKQKYPEIKVISVDIPTGMDSDTGSLHSPTIFPDETLVLQHFKSGMVQSPAIESLGRPVLLDIGLADQKFSAKYQLVSGVDLPHRPRNSHKGDFGHVLVIAGSKNMPGAGLLSAAACLRSGAGLVTMISSGITFVNSYPEIMYKFIADDLNHAANEIIADIHKYNCLIIGPGLGLGQEQTALVFQLLREVAANKIACVLDADGLNALAELHAMSVPLTLPSVVITPHPGEAARLLQVSVQEIQSNRYLACQKLSEKFGCAVILKGASSVFFNNNTGNVNTSGGPFLATAGSGDVLSGILAALLASGQNQQQAGPNSMFLHGVAGELANSEHNGPIIASDIVDKIPHALGKYIN